MQMTKQQEQKLAKAKKEAAKNPPAELKKIMIDTSKSPDKRSATEILMEMRYGPKGYDCKAYK